MKVALVQFDSSRREPPDERLARALEMVRGCRGADLICLPELWAVGYFRFDDYAQRAESLEGRTIAALAACASELGAIVHAGSIVEALADGGLRNTAAIIDRTGRVVSTYSKIHTFGYKSVESQLVRRGDSLSLLKTDFGTMATAICYDLRFPSFWRSLVTGGAEMVVLPAAWPAARLAHWQILTTARAIEGQIFVVACNGVGGTGETELAGHSRVVSPSGDVLLEARSDEGVHTCELDPSAVSAAREVFPMLRDDRGDYTDLVTSPAGPGSRRSLT